MLLLCCCMLFCTVFVHGGLLGAPKEVDKNDDNVSSLAKFGIEEINKQSEKSGLTTSRHFVKVLHVTKQIVAGTNYVISLHVVNGNKDELCNVVIYVPLPYMKLSNELIKHHCQPYQPTHGELTQAVATAVEYYNSGSNSMHRSVKISVQAISQQDVADSTTFTFSMQLGETSCSNHIESKGKGIETCPLKKDGMKYDCTYTVVYQTKYVVDSQQCTQKIDLKQKFEEKLAGLLLTPNNMLPISPDTNLGSNIKSAVDDLLKHQKRNILNEDVAPLLSDVEQKVLGALRVGIMDNSRSHGKGINMLGRDGHDVKTHGNMMGQDGHDMKPHGNMLGQDGHDMMRHGNMMGRDGHDMTRHANMMGQDGHDMMRHGNMMGQDGHDMMRHGNMMGQDGQDMMRHGNMMGQDGHDMKPHGKMLGQDGHDMMRHGNMFGGDGHDMKPHGNMVTTDDLCHLDHFETFMKKHGKMYLTESEKKKRFLVYCDNMKLIHKLNVNEQSTASYGITKFADLTPTEFRANYLSKKDWSQMPNHFGANMKNAAIPKSAPTAFDWREKGAVTPVKNQGSCGSCWAFSTTGNIEGQWSVRRGQLISLSEQELVDCDKIDEGCDGGLPSNAYQVIMKLGGLETEKAYKYEGADEKCTFNRSKVEVKISGAVNISSNENDMAAWLAKNGPISIGINAMAMQFYFGGISHPWKIFCNPEKLDHGVLIVGYGVEKGEPYWTIKNSWGPDWGEKGYYRVYRGSGVCGLNTMCTSAVV